MTIKENKELNCVFCKIIKGEIPAEKVYEDNDILAFLDITPINAGHTLVIPKAHYESLFELPDDILQKISLKLRDLGIAIKEAVGAEGLNIGMNNREAAGQIVLHAHFHLIPRYLTDGYKHWGGRKYKDGEIEEVAKKIKLAIK
ncbi:MAG: HIT family protein [bacterium]